MLKELRSNKKARAVYTLVCVVLAGFFQAAIIQVFMKPMNLLSSGFTGVAILIENVTSTFFGFSFSTSLGMLALNIPVALFCSKTISKRFTFFSLLQVFCASLFLKVLHFGPLFDDPLLNIIFGGFSYGLMTVLALKGNASTGGTDFIALYISNKKGKSIWSYVFIFNACLIVIFGAMFGWEYAGYSILFQFISTKTIESFYHRYERMTLQITTTKPDEVIDTYIKHYRHGISRLDGHGGYSKAEMSILHTVVSSYEVVEVVELLREVDPHVIVNAFKTENFFGGFYLKPIE
ncbi:MAG: YitT family protein [Erysipelotrichaceae bacterium]|nr:YitT family protein [Erysipelotrichaceae bacterium]MDY5252714.1 YitT family protein [Erysipelotrichaceae bacterium]